MLASISFTDFSGLCSFNPNKEKKKKKVLVVSADVYRPAAIKQLETLAETVGIDFFPSTVQENPVTIASNALKHAQLQFYDVLLVDTAGRLHVDEGMMEEKIGRASCRERV